MRLVSDVAQAHPETAFRFGRMWAVFDRQGCVIAAFEDESAAREWCSTAGYRYGPTVLAIESPKAPFRHPETAPGALTYLAQARNTT